MSKFISWDDKIMCLTREIILRKRVYAKRVAEEKMTQDFADREIEVMTSVLRDIEKLAGRLM